MNHQQIKWKHFACRLQRPNPHTHTHTKSTHSGFFSFFLQMIVKNYFIEILLVGDLFFFCVSICHSLMYAIVFRSTVNIHRCFFFMHFKIFEFFLLFACFNSCFVFCEIVTEWRCCSIQQNRVGLLFYRIYMCIHCVCLLLAHRHTCVCVCVCGTTYQYIYLTQYNSVNYSI